MAGQRNGFRLIGALCLVLMAATLGGCSVTLPSIPAPTTVIGPNEGYLLETGNRIRVNVFNESNLSGEFQIDPVGNVALPLVGNVSATGLTAKAMARRIEDVLSRAGYLREPKVAVEVLTFRPFYVLGEVRLPGEFAYTSGMTVLGAIAKAGGYDYRAHKGEAVLVRIVDGTEMEFRAVERTPLQPGDIIKVVERYF
ncbi:Polysaccharide export protein [Candidatus Terasakiella magnetica]|nr:Polysaccharide export protein [Candidatus Terasakiella magnetica]